MTNDLSTAVKVCLTRAGPPKRKIIALQQWNGTMCGGYAIARTEPPDGEMEKPRDLAQFEQERIMPRCPLRTCVVNQSRIAFGLAVWLAIGTSVCLADDWPQWLGQQRDGVWRETGIVEIADDGPMVWRANWGRLQRTGGGERSRVCPWIVRPARTIRGATRGNSRQRTRAVPERTRWRHRVGARVRLPVHDLISRRAADHAFDRWFDCVLAGSNG